MWQKKKTVGQHRPGCHRYGRNVDGTAVRQFIQSLRVGSYGLKPDTLHLHQSLQRGAEHERIVGIWRVCKPQDVIHGSESEGLADENSTEPEDM